MSKIKVRATEFLHSELRGFDYPVTQNYSYNSQLCIQKLAKKLRRALKDKEPYFIFKGSSGAFIAALFARHFPLAYFFQVKIHEKGTHFGNCDYKKHPLPHIALIRNTHEFVFVDDLIESGQTLETCVCFLDKVNCPAIKIALIMCSNDDCAYENCDTFNIETLIYGFDAPCI